MKKFSPGKALIVDDEKTYRLLLKSILVKQGYQIIEAENGQQAVDLFRHENPSIVFMDVMMPVLDGYQATRQIKAIAGTRFVPIIFLTAINDEAALAHCIEAGGDDFVIKPYDRTILQSKIRSLQRIAALNREVQGMYSMIHREQQIAESVFVNAIQSANIDNRWLRHTVRPARIFSGDLVLSAYSPTRDLFFLMGDFTGHGLLAALGAMPVSEVFRSMTAKGFGPEAILISINNKLRVMLPTGMFFGALLVVVNHDLEQVRVFNAGMPELLIVDGASHRIKHRLASSGMPLGVDADNDPREMLQYAPIAHNDKILMYSDGLIEARNGEDVEFGNERLIEAISTAPQDRIYDHLLDQLDRYCEGRAQADDVTLVEITCVDGLLPRAVIPSMQKPAERRERQHRDWKLSLRFDGARLRETNPVPVLINYLLEMETLRGELQSLFTVLSELYANALDHGVLALDSSMTRDPDEFEVYFKTRQSRLARLDSGYVQFDLSAEQGLSQRSILVRVEDSGAGFAFSDPALSPAAKTAANGRGLTLVRGLCESLEFEGNGNIVNARFSWNTR